MQHAPDDPRSNERYLLDQPVGWSRVGIAVGAVLVAALLMLATFPDATVAVVDAVMDRLPAVIG